MLVAPHVPPEVAGELDVLLRRPALVLDAAEWMKLRHSIDHLRWWVAVVRSSCEPPEADPGGL